MSALWITKFRGKDKPHGERVETTWKGIVRSLSTGREIADEAAKDTLPLWSPSTFLPGQSDADRARGKLDRPDYRSDDTVEAVCCLGFDDDAVVPPGGEHGESCGLPLEVTLAHWGSLGVRGIVTSSPRHTVERPRWRAVLPLSRAVTGDEYRLLWAEVERQMLKLGHEVGAAKNPSRAWYVPAHLPGVEYVARELEGEPLDVDAWLLAAREHEQQRDDARERRQHRSPRGGLDDLTIEQRARLRAIAEGALAKEVERVATAAHGERNAALNTAAFTLARFVEHGLLDVEVVVEALTTAARDAGLDASETRATIRSGLTAGGRRATEEGFDACLPPDWGEDHAAHPSQMGPDSASIIDDGEPPPYHEAALHGICGRIVRLLEPCTEAHPMALMVSLLSLFAAAVGRGPVLLHGAQRVWALLQILLVGPTNSGRKGTAEAAVKLFADEIARLEGESPLHPALARRATGLTSGEGLIYHARDATTARSKSGEDVEVPGVDDKRLRVVEPEFAGVLRAASRSGSTLTAVVRSAADGEDLGTLSKSQPTRATGAHVCIVGHCTPVELSKELADVDIANGFANRFLVVYTRRLRLLPLPPEPDATALEALATKALAALRWVRKRGDTALRLSADAQRIWRGERDDAADGLYALLSEDAEGIVGALAARATRHVQMVALLLALLDQAEAVEPVHLLAATALWAYSEESLRRVFGDRRGDPVDDKILDAVRRSGDGLTREEVNGRLGHHQPAAVIDAAIERLREAGLVEVAKEATEGRSRTIVRAAKKAKKGVHRDPLGRFRGAFFAFFAPPDEEPEPRPATDDPADPEPDDGFADDARDDTDRPNGTPVEPPPVEGDDDPLDFIGATGGVTGRPAGGRS